MATSVATLAGDQVLAIAQADAALAYRDLSPYRIQLALEQDGWHVDYELKDAKLKLVFDSPGTILGPGIAKTPCFFTFFWTPTENVVPRFVDYFRIFTLII